MGLTFASSSAADLLAASGMRTLTAGLDWGTATGVCTAAAAAATPAQVAAFGVLGVGFKMLYEGGPY
jgi:hypothetical protein